MFSWELTLAVRRTTCELRLWALYNRYGNVVVERKRHPEMGPSWHKKDDVLAAIHREIRRELDEIRFLRAQQQASAVGVFRLVLHKSGGDFHQVEPGPRIIDLIQQVIETNEAATGWKDTDYGMGVIAGLKEALDVFYNPYKYLSPEQQKEFTSAEDARDQIIRNRSGVRGPLGYGAMHGRVAKAKGSASTHDCAHCGQRPEGKMDWAYDHKDPNEQTETAFGKYSLEVDHYIPLCCKCHAAFDERGYKRRFATGPPESLARRPAGQPGPTLAQLRAEADTEVVVRRARP